MVKERPLIHKEINVNIIKLEPQEEIPYHVHKDTKYNYILKGSITDGKKEYLPGDIVENIKGSGHFLIAGPKGCELLVIWCGEKI
jgi:anti-sigma factor ChrR (cupin superfamily)